jgi:RND family efflux transporter MFP subunit
MGDGASGSSTDDAQTGLARSRVAVRAAQAQRDLAVLEVEHMTIKAPFDGEIASLSAEVGELVGAGNPLVRLVDHSTLRLDVGLVADEIALARDERTQWIIRADSETYPASLEELSPAADPRTMDWRARLLVDASSLAAGLPVDVVVKLPLDEATGVVPYAALTDADQAVWALRDDRVKRVPIVTVADVPGGVAVAGVQSGEQVVVFGKGGLRDDEEVVVLETPL